ncbi:MAG TPA: hypothetical protein PLN52_03200, partial [Opitutaceae bacterium]|nr:hypothetical protein [Opitutaceae bacterium]
MEPEPIVLADVPLLFVDDHALTSVERVVRTLHPARTHPTPVIEPDRPWEGVRVYTYGSIDRSPTDDLFRVWYMSHSRVLYATSVDGFAWSKPNLNLHSFEGSSANNIVAPGFH